METMNYYQSNDGKSAAAIELMLIRAAKDGIPVRVIARIFGYPDARVREILSRALYYHRISNMPPDEWPHLNSVSQQLPCSEMIWKGHPDQDVADTCQAFGLEQGEACVLMYLVKKAGHFCSADTLIGATTMNPEKIASNIIRVRVHRVRKVIAPIGARIITKRGFGYMITPKAAELVICHISAFRQIALGEAA